jgi:hypothetical protein
MRLQFLFALLLALALCPAAVQAREVRYPETGAPSMTFSVPDDWETQLDSVGNMLVIPVDKSGGFSLTLAEYAGGLDDLATEVMTGAGADPAAKSGNDAISGFQGFDYESALVNKSGVRTLWHLVLVRIDPTHIASVMMITTESASPEQRAALATLFKSIVLSAN